MFNISQSAIEQAVNDMRNGNSDEFVKQFFASRPEWLEDQDEQQTAQATKGEKQEETAKA
jgi:hypothetical protein